MKQTLSSENLENHLGTHIRSLRLQQNRSGQDLSSAAGVSLTALRNLETGTGATIHTLIRVIRALGREDWLSSLAPTISINPLHMIREKTPRQRASRKPKNDPA